MRKLRQLLITSLTALALLMWSNLGWGQVNIASWSFDALTAAPGTTNVIAADYGEQSGTAFVYLDGSNGSSLWTSEASNPELTTFAGSTLNDPRPTANAGNALAIANMSANGKSLVFKFTTIGYTNIELSFATRGTGTGFNQHEWSWSLDNITYTSFGTNTANTATSFTTRTLDLSSITEINDAELVYIKLTVSGASAAAGNNRIDNFVIKSYPSDIDPPVTTFFPLNGAVDVPLDVNPTITFDEVIYTSAGVLVDNTNVEALISFTYDDGEPVKAPVEVPFTATIASNVITIVPTAELDNEEVYTITIAAVQDVDENLMEGPASATFTTLAATTPTLELTGTYAGPYYAGDEVIVTWTATNLDFVVVEAWVPHENMWIAMTESVDAELGTASFNVPLDAPYSANYKIRVRNAEAETPVDESATFRVRAVTDNLATVRAYAVNDEFRYDGEAVVTATDAFNNRKFIQDESAAILIFDNTAVITTPYVIGDGMSGIVGRKTISSNMVRLVPLADPGAPASTGNPVVPTVMTIDEITSDDQAKLVTIEMVNFTTTGNFVNGTNYPVTDGTNNIVFRTDFFNVDYIGTPRPESKFNVTAVVHQFSADMQITARNLADFVVFSNDATLETFTLGGVDVLELPGIVVNNPSEEGAELFVTDISEFIGIVAVPTDENATVTIGVNGLEIVEADWADYAFESGDVVLAIVEAEDGTLKYYKVTLVDYVSATIDVESIDFYINWPNEPVEILITWNDASEVTAFEVWNDDAEMWIDLPADTPDGPFWEVIPVNDETAIFKIYLENAPSKSTKEGDFFIGETEDVRIVFDLGVPAEFEVMLMVKTFDITFVAVDENEVPIENFTVTVTPVDEGGIASQTDNVVEVAASFAYNYTIVAFGYATVEGTTDVIMEDQTITIELESTDVPKVITYWNFNHDGPATDTNWDQPIHATIGGGVITYTFTEAWSFAGTTINGIEINGENENGGSFAPRGGVDMVNNGAYFTMEIPTTGFEGIVITYPTRRTSTGFNSHQVLYTINGTDWLEFQTYSIATYENGWLDNQLITLDFTGVEGVDYNADFAVRLVLTGVTSAAGNNRFDNIKVTGFGLNYETNILSFAHPLQMSPTVIDQGAGTVALQVLNGTDLSALAPSFTLSSGATAWVGGDQQIPGESVVDFTNPVTYTILAENGETTRDWTVTITQAPVSSLAAITAFSVPNMLGNAVIDSDEKTVHAIVSYGTDLTDLVPTIAISLGATVNPVSGVAQDFTTPVVYTVTAQDGTTTVDWTVTVAEVTLLPISEIRFTPHEENVSLYQNTIVATTGIVTAYYYYLGNASGYYLQDGVNEWCGIMAYTGSGTLPAIGDEVRVSGMIGSFGRNTQFTNSPLTEVLSSGNDLPAPVVLTTAEVSHYKWQSMILRVENAECTSSANSEVNDGSGPIRLDRQLFNYTALAEGSFYNIVAIGASDNQFYRLRPRSANDIELISSVKPVWGESIATYPNPFSNTIWLDNVENAKRVVVVNLLGQQVITKELHGDSSTSIQTENLPSGVYLVTIVNAKGERTVRKMIKR